MNQLKDYLHENGEFILWLIGVLSAVAWVILASPGAAGSG